MRPTSVEPVNATLATSGCSTSRCPHVRPGPATTLTTPSGMPAASAIRSNSSAVSGVSSAGLSTTVLPAASAGASFHDAIVSGKFHGVISADDTERLAEGHRRRRRRPGSCRRAVALGPAGVVAEGVDHHPHLAARVADRLAGVARLEHGQRLVLAGERVGQPVQQRASGRRARPRATPGSAALARATAASASSAPARGISASTCLGRRLEDGERHSRSKPRKRSQSVTAASKARSSTSAWLR